jgi:hypothetical protein
VSGGILVYCNGKQVLATPVGDGCYRCACGRLFKIPVPSDAEITEAA